MALNLELPVTEENSLRPRIVVLGVGGAGGNAVNNMIRSNLSGVEFVVANTDAQALELSLAEKKMQLGNETTRGLGAGSYAEVGRASAEEAVEELEELLENADMLFITAGMGGGTGTGAAPYIAEMAKEKGILTVAVVTKPFDFEGKHRMKTAGKGIAHLRNLVDTLIIIPNQNLFRIANTNTTIEDAFKTADDVLHAGVRGITDLITMPGLINLDFADVKTIMTKMGKAMMGTGESEGDERAMMAAEAAICNPLLDDVSINGAKGVIINITGGTDMTLFEVEEITKHINSAVDEDANIIVGSAFNEDMYGKLRVSVVATGIEDEFNPEEFIEEEPKEEKLEEETEKKRSRIGYRYVDVEDSIDKVREKNLFSFGTKTEGAHNVEMEDGAVVKKKRKSFIPSAALDPEGNGVVSFASDTSETKKPKFDLHADLFSEKKEQETKSSDDINQGIDEEVKADTSSFSSISDKEENEEIASTIRVGSTLGGVASLNGDKTYESSSRGAIPQSPIRNTEQQQKKPKTSFFNKLFNKGGNEESNEGFRLDSSNNGDIKISDVAYYDESGVSSDIADIPAYLRKKK